MVQHAAYIRVEGGRRSPKKEEMGTRLVYSKLQPSFVMKNKPAKVSVCPVFLPTNNFFFLWDLPPVTMKKNYSPDPISNKVNETIPIDFYPFWTRFCITDCVQAPQTHTPFVSLPVGTLQADSYFFPSSFPGCILERNKIIIQ